MLGASCLILHQQNLSRFAVQQAARRANCTARNDSPAIHSSACMKPLPPPVVVLTADWRLPMKILYQIKFAAAVAAVIAVPTMNYSAHAQQGATVPTDPGLKAGTGPINPGSPQQAPSQSSAATDIPTPDEARRAFLTPVSKQPSAGTVPNAPRPEAPTTGGPGANQESKNAVGGPQGLTTHGTVPTPGSGTSSAQAAPTGPNSTAGAEPPPSGPIGSFGETIPAKFSERNDILDRVPIMAWPLPLTDQQRKQVYDAVMADQSPPVAGADALKPSSELSTEQALNGMRPLPESVRSIEGLGKLQYVRANNKVLLVEPSTRTVIDQITS